MSRKIPTPFSGDKLRVSAAAMKAAAEEIRPERLIGNINLIPTPEEVGITPDMLEMMTLREGVLICGGNVGLGKSTTLNALINDQLHRGHKKVLIIEGDNCPEPFGPLMAYDGKTISRVLTGIHVASTAEGVREALSRDAGDIIIAELRDEDTLRAATKSGLAGQAIYTTALGTSVANIIQQQMLRLKRHGKPDEAARVDALEAISIVVYNAPQKGHVITRTVLVLTPAIRRLLLSLPLSEWEAALGSHLVSWTTSLSPFYRNIARNSVLAALQIHAEESGEPPPDEVPDEAVVFVVRLTAALARFPSSTHLERLEMVARAFGYRNWHAARGRRG